MRQFSAPHLAALAGLLLAAAGSLAFVRHDRRPDGRPGPATIWLCRALAVTIAAGWVGEYTADVIQGIWSTRYDLPLQLTDAISVLSVIALWTRRRPLAELLYLWALTASLQATITPDLAWSFPSVFYFTYFDYHVGAVVAALVLVFGLGLYPTRGAPWRAFAATLAWAAVAAAGDLLSGGNYMYLRAKPAHGSLLSVLGPWPWYLVAIALIGLAMLFGLQWISNRVGRLDPIENLADSVSRRAA